MWVFFSCNTPFSSSASKILLCQPKFIAALHHPTTLTLHWNSNGSISAYLGGKTGFVFWRYQWYEKTECEMFIKKQWKHNLCDKSLKQLEIGWHDFSVTLWYSHFTHITAYSFVSSKDTKSCVLLVMCCHFWQMGHLISWESK